MANTNDLRNIVEPHMLNEFWRVRGVEALSQRTHLAEFLHGMQVDGIGIQREKKRLYICEATASGYVGHRGKAFHVGALRKFSDAFARFSILMQDRNREALLAAATRHHGLVIGELECHLVIPKGSRFIQALGYRERLLQLGIMQVTEVTLPQDIEASIRRVLGSAGAEMM